MSKFPDHKADFIKQAILEVLFALFIALFIASFTQHFALVLFISLFLVLIRAYYYAYAAWEKIGKKSFKLPKGFFAQIKVIQHINFVKRKAAYNRDLYNQMIDEIKSYLFLADFPLALFDSDGNLFWHNRALPEQIDLAALQNSTNKLSIKLTKKIQAKKNKLKFRTNLSDKYLEVQILRIDKKTFLVFFTDLTDLGQSKNQQRDIFLELNACIEENTIIIEQIFSNISNKPRIDDQELKILNSAYLSIKQGIDNFSSKKT